MRLIGLTLALGLLLAACTSGDGSDPDRILQLPTGDITEIDFRLQARAGLMDMAGLVGNVLLDRPHICDSIADLNAEDAAKLLIMVERPGGSATPFSEAISDDQQRAAAIIKEECARIR
jgi:hypothetical protein